MFAAFVINVDNGDGEEGISYLVLAYSKANAIDRVLEEEAVRKNVGNIKITGVISSQYLLSTEEQLQELLLVLSKWGANEYNRKN